MSHESVERFSLRVTPAVRRALTERLPESVAFAAFEFINGPLLDNPHRVGRRLLAPLDDRYSARRGSYRIIYRIDDKEQTVVPERSQESLTTARSMRCKQRAATMSPHQRRFTPRSRPGRPPRRVLSWETAGVRDARAPRRAPRLASDRAPFRSSKPGTGRPADPAASHRSG
ncbi:MAG: type II toxin-antitoxin system RelE/ParE family toxin [Pseudonocardiales bacterium]|nr:type II toxin-antitoxin system RelE/ParE family toxin [Pseudonocardiales bacterium]